MTRVLRAFAKSLPCHPFCHPIIIISALPPMRLASLGMIGVAEREALLRCFARRRSEAACGVEVDALEWKPAAALLPRTRRDAARRGATRQKK